MAYLTDEQHRLVTQAVSAAELESSGEIVTVLADRSDGYSDIALAWAAVAAFTAMSFVALFPEFLLDTLATFRGGWQDEWSRAEFSTVLIGVGLVVFLAIWAVQWWDKLKFALIPGPVKTARVHERAVSHFKVGAERRTHGRTGIMIYLSMREHRAEIVADEPIAAKVSANVWGEAMADMLAEIKQGNIAEGMAAGVRNVGSVLSEHFPRGEDDTNELPDRLIEI